MSRFIPLTMLGGSVIYINPAHIVSFLPLNNGTTTTRIMTVDDDSTDVQESVDEVFGLVSYISVNKEKANALEI